MLVDFGQISLYHGRNENYCFKVSAAFLDYSVRGKRLVLNCNITCKDLNVVRSLN